MTKSRRSLKNLAKIGLNLLIAAILISGCSTSTTPTFHTQDIEKAVKDICEKEYDLFVKAKLVGKTLWIYLPIEDIYKKPDKPAKYIEKFSIQSNSVSLEKGILKVQYLIRSIPEEEKTQEYVYNEEAVKKINSVWKVLRRVIFSSERAPESQPEFFCLVTADIKNGFERREVFYILDLKKVSYGFIPWEEFYHRIVAETYMSPEIIDDKEGGHVNCFDIDMRKFVPDQIWHRINFKFQKGEVSKDANMDEEITKIAKITLNIYGFDDFTYLELDNMLTQNKSSLNRTAVLR